MVLLNHKENQKFTYKDYLTWPDDERWEIIDGIAYDMSAAPVSAHQRIVSRLSAFFEPILNGKPCIPYPAPFDVVLSEETVVQPDFLVVCDPEKMIDTHISGAPDLVIEILSQSSIKKDRFTKRDLYERNGVREYLIFDPLWVMVYRHILDEYGKYPSFECFESQEELSLISLPGITMPLWQIFGVEKKDIVHKQPGPKTSVSE